MILPEHQSDTKVLTMTMEILPEPASNKLCVLRTASATAKPCQEDSSKFYLITGIPDGGSIQSRTSDEDTIAFMRVSHVSWRGTLHTNPSTGYSLSFGPSIGPPDVLLATSSSGSVHALLLGSAVDQRSKRSSTFLGSIIPDTVSDALDSAHHVLHNAVSPRVKSYAVIHKVERADDSSTSESTSFSNYGVLGRYDVSVPALHKKPRRFKINALYPEGVNTPYSSYSDKIFWKISNVVPTPRNP
ncbi:hypothetical protein Tco_0093750 [Tanacetum coccineum]